MKLSFKKFNIGHAALALMGLTILACGGGSGDGGTDRILTRNFLAVNAGYSGNSQKFVVNSENVPTSAADGVTLPFGVLSASKVQVVNKQLDPIPFVIKNAETDTISDLLQPAGHQQRSPLLGVIRSRIVDSRRDYSAGAGERNNGRF